MSATNLSSKLRVAFKVINRGLFTVESVRIVKLHKYFLRNAFFATKGFFKVGLYIQAKITSVYLSAATQNCLSL